MEILVQSSFRAAERWEGGRRGQFWVLGGFLGEERRVRKRLTPAAAIFAVSMALFARL